MSGKIVFHEISPWCQKGWGRSRTQAHTSHFSDQRRKFPFASDPNSGSFCWLSWHKVGRPLLRAKLGELSTKHLSPCWWPLRDEMFGQLTWKRKGRALRGGKGWGWQLSQERRKGLESFSSVQSLSRVWLFATPWITAHQASLSITNSRSSLKLISIESVMPSSHLILCHPLLLLPPIPPSIRVFSNESTLHMRWPKYWSFSFSIIPSKEIPSERTGWISLQSKGLSRVFSNTTVQKHQFFGAQLSSQSNSHIHTWPLEKP